MMDKQKPVSKEERLAQALRANLRRRKVGGTVPDEAKPNSPKSAD
jgi:hypothetical protein